ncbi:hypothetical protein ACFL5D_01635 [Candidatus Neomarinimicrobiota bacterium]
MQVNKEFGFIWGNIYIHLTIIGGLILFIVGLLMLDEFTILIGSGLLHIISAYAIYRRKKILGLYLTYGLLITKLLIDIPIFLNVRPNIPIYLVAILITVLWGVYFFNRRSIFDK